MQHGKGYRYRDNSASQQTIVMVKKKFRAGFRVITSNNADTGNYGHKQVKR